MENICSYNAKEFLLSGACECEIISKATSYSYTYKIIRYKKNIYKLYNLVNTVNCIDGTVREINEYQYIGYYDSKTNKCTVYDNRHRETYYWTCISWVLTHTPLELDSKIIIHNIARCAICGRILRDKKSITLGIGPTCRRKYKCLYEQH